MELRADEGCDEGSSELFLFKKVSNVVCFPVSINLDGIFGNGLSSDPNIGILRSSILR